MVALFESEVTIIPYFEKKNGKTYVRPIIRLPKRKLGDYIGKKVKVVIYPVE